MSRFLRHATLVVALVAGLPLAVRAQAAARIDSTKLAVIRQLLEHTQAADLALSAIESSIPAQRQANPRIPAVFWDRFLVKAREGRSEFIDMVAAAYDRHFTIDELRQLDAFYATTLGRKLLKEQPALLQESMLAGQQWGQRIGAAVGAQLAAEGVTITP